MTEKHRLNSEAINHDSTPEEILFWEFDAERSKTGLERAAFKKALAKYACLLNKNSVNVDDHEASSY